MVQSSPSPSTLRDRGFRTDGQSVAAYVEAAAKTVPTFRSKRVTPHSFRHATAVHLVSADVDITVIRSWLGHVSLDTTNHYAQANLASRRSMMNSQRRRSTSSMAANRDKKPFFVWFYSTQLRCGSD